MPVSLPSDIDQKHATFLKHYFHIRTLLGSLKITLSVTKLNSMAVVSVP